MNIIFRADASTQIGTGHVMRCLTLADSLSAGGANCYFICKELNGNLISLIETRDYCVFSFKPDLKSFDPRSTLGLYGSWLGSTQASDACSSIGYVRNIKPDWVVVDNYSLDSSWEKLLNPYCANMLVVDDLANRQHECDLLVDQTVLRSKDIYKDKVNYDCRVLCGSQYSLLRPEFRDLRQKGKNKSLADQPFKILLSLGGVDKNDDTSKVIEALIECDLPDNAEVIIVMGPKAPFIDQVLEKKKLLPYPSAVLIGVTNMAELMSDSHICIGGAGSSSWERCCMGLPSVTVILADNQNTIARNLEVSGAGIAINVVDLRKSLNTAIKKLVTGWNSYRDACLDIVDGCGSSRVVRAMEEIVSGVENDG